MDRPAGAAWSDQVEAADWIKPRLSHDWPGTVTSILPGGFEEYARVLHPAEEPFTGKRIVRWAEVAAWSGLPLRGDSQFHSVAMSRERPNQPAPWSGQGPERGTLYPPDAAVLATVLRAWSATPDQCWFCLWNGFGYGPGESVALVRTGGEPPGGDLLDEDPRGEDLDGDPDAGELLDLFRDPVPEAVRQGPRVELPHRAYLLYTGPAEAAVGVAGPAYQGQSANLWWPQDHAWCVASDVDLPWTYVGGPAALIDQLVADQRIEAQRASPGDAVGREEPWVTDAVTAAAEQLLTSGEAVIETSLGTVRAYLRRSSWHRRGLLRTNSDDGSGGTSGSGRVWLSRGSSREDLRNEVMLHLTFDVIALAEGHA